MHRRMTSSREDARRNQPSRRQKQSRGEMARRTRCDGSEAGAAGRRRDVLQPESHVAHGNGAGAAAVRTSSSGSTQSRHMFGKAKMDVHTAAVSRTAEWWKQPQRPSSREGRTRGAVAAAKSGEAPTLATVWTDPEHTTLARDAGHTGPHGARLHRCDAPRQARAQTGSEWADARGWGRLLADRDRVFFVV
uniref:Uncharacterized protein n=1 Tax=Rousettus aegyptiacus TaxID=9407 RepID=A0A7J8BT90_ROUAE|nr:hypothetical protein HJG63_009653 [Rousettus aegyptiacus]